MISAVSRPSCVPAAASLCERSANWSCSSRGMSLSFAIFSALCPIVSPVVGSAIAGVIGMRSRGRRRASAPNRAGIVFALDRGHERVREAARVQDRHVRQRLRAAGDRNVRVAERDLVRRVGDRLVRRCARPAHRSPRASLSAASASAPPPARCSARARSAPPFRRRAYRSPRHRARCGATSSATTARPRSCAESDLNSVPDRSNGVRSPATMATRRPLPKVGMSESYTIRCVAMGGQGVDPRAPVPVAFLDARQPTNRGSAAARRWRRAGHARRSAHPPRRAARSTCS